MARETHQQADLWWVPPAISNAPSAQHARFLALAAGARARMASAGVGPCGLHDFRTYMRRARQVRLTGKWSA